MAQIHRVGNLVAVHVTGATRYLLAADAARLATCMGAHAADILAGRAHISGSPGTESAPDSEYANGDTHAAADSAFKAAVSRAKRSEYDWRNAAFILREHAGLICAHIGAPFLRPAWTEDRKPYDSGFYWENLDGDRFYFDHWSDAASDAADSMGVTDAERESVTAEDLAKAEAWTPKPEAHSMVRAADLRAGDRADLEGDRFATMGQPDPDHSFPFEYATVTGVEVESADCVRVDYEGGAFGCPPSHLVKVALPRPEIVETAPRFAVRLSVAEMTHALSAIDEARLGDTDAKESDLIATLVAARSRATEA